ncbi:hypothetical protein [Bacillus horti]|uniref:Holin n=1 Tax=Caldalkalibacillus horti TaxID=77523 RepID=A0ABT9VW12_9BACI|nr:hypothetical protein [Bacillus horti]MDQ0165162.1 hypothetical protein [Bacillus horti]
MKMEGIFIKLSSRKFWSLLAGWLTSLLILFNFDENTTAQIVAVVGAFGSIVVYIFAEAYVDSKSVQSVKNSKRYTDDI